MHILPEIIMRAFEAFAAAEITNAMSKSPKLESGPAQVATPSVDVAKATADEAVTQQRRMLLASGGQTDFTGGSGSLLGGQVQSKTLLGG